MSEERHPYTDPEDTAILQALRALDVVDSESLREIVRARDEAEDALLRRFTEVLGLLAYGAEPVTPSEDLERRILSTLAGDETQRVDPSSAPRPSALVPSPEWPSREPRDTPAAGPSRGPRIPRSLAAVLAFLVLGLGGWSLWLRGQVAEQNGLLASQERTLAELGEELEAVRTEQSAIASERRELMAELEERFRLVTASDTEICPLRPPARSPDPDARGILWIAADHQNWYLEIEGLDPREGSGVYQLWFVVGDERRPVKGGVFRVSREGEIRIGSPAMPDDTRAALVTLEPTEEPERPTGPVVLYGDEVMRIL